MFTTALTCADSSLSNQENTPDTALYLKDLTTSAFAERPHFLVGKAYQKF